MSKVGGLLSTIQGDIVGTQNTQTLTNKTLTSPTITAPTITDAVFAGTVVDSTFIIADNSDATKLLKFELGGFTTGTTRTITVPDTSDTMVTLAATQTLTNKTLTTPRVANNGGIYDDSGNEQLLFGKTASAVNYASVGNSATGSAVSLSALGDDTNINLNLVPKGTGQATVGGVGVMLAKTITFTENATNTTHTGTVAIPAGATLVDVIVNAGALWGAAAAVLKVGDTADDDGIFVGVDLKATDLLVGEVLSMGDTSNWGGKNGAYLVAATGQRGPTTSNFGTYYAAGSNITGIITVTTPAVTTGRTYMTVIYTLGAAAAATPSGP